MRFFTIIGACNVAAGMATLPTICQSDPPLPLKAGELVSAYLGKWLVQGAKLPNSTFPPKPRPALPPFIGICVKHPTRSMPANGKRLCVGQPSPMCNSAVIANSRGSGDAKAINRYLEGRLGCVEPVAAVVTNTLTTTSGTIAITTTMTTAVASLTTRFFLDQTASDGSSKAPTWPGSNTDHTKPATAVNPTAHTLGPRTSAPTQPNPTTPGTCNPASCLALVPLPDPTMSSTATSTPVPTTAAPTTTTPSAQTASSTAGNTKSALGPTIAATTITVIQTMTGACRADKSQASDIVLRLGVPFNVL
ncbi:hypothetical protein X797_011885 [Metarhizium robertsii]|uniref:Uncharacterized protein n=1 Tax=Metarhizium robertsii TaxID=568076 RepID=A0A014P1C1_9HYPO|nr:hypothetical protein X797_011885 [Metarhizium robertsii]